jgi:hypothetical protein
MTQPAKPVRMFYIDDSGSVDTGHIVYSWIETTPHEWATGLRTWLDFRKTLYANYKIPPSAELHAAHLVAGRGRPSTDATVNKSKKTRRDIMESALQAIGSIPEVHVGTIYRTTTTTGTAYAAERDALYDELITHLDDRLCASGELGIVFMDGIGTENGYYTAHRRMKLQDRSIIEDPLFQASHRSQTIQMADLVAWTAYQAIQQHPAKTFAWHWYDKHLRTADLNGAPIPR